MATRTACHSGGSHSPSATAPRAAAVIRTPTDGKRRLDSCGVVIAVATRTACHSGGSHSPSATAPRAAAVIRTPTDGKSAIGFLRRCDRRGDSDCLSPQVGRTRRSATAPRAAAVIRTPTDGKRRSGFLRRCDRRGDSDCLSLRWVALAECDSTPSSRSHQNADGWETAIGFLRRCDRRGDSDCLSLRWVALAECDRTPSSRSHQNADGWETAIEFLRRCDRRGDSDCLSLSARVTHGRRPHPEQPQATDRRWTGNRRLDSCGVAIAVATRDCLSLWWVALAECDAAHQPDPVSRW